MTRQGTRRTKQQVVAEFRHAEILDAARRVFAARGFEGASVDDIARRARVAKGTVYLYYPSKRALYRAALRRGLESLVHELRRRVYAAHTLRDKIRAFMTTKIDYFEQHGDFFRIYCAEAGRAGCRPADLERDLEAFSREQLALLQDALALPGAGGRPGRPRPAAAFALADMTHGVVTRRLFGRSRAETRRDVAFLLEMAEKGLAAR